MNRFSAMDLCGVATKMSLEMKINVNFKIINTKYFTSRAPKVRLIKIHSKINLTFMTTTARRIKRNFFAFRS